jgi:hypothetical protein
MSGGRAFAAGVVLTTIVVSPMLRAGGGQPAAPGRTPEGTPDLQGIWDFRTATPLERPRELGDRAYFTLDEAAAFENRNAERIGATVAVHPPDWLDYGMRLYPDRRASLIVDPPDGRVPALTKEAIARATARRSERRNPPEGPEDMTLGERCLIFSAGPPILPGPYNNNLRIVQTPAAVVLETEMIHDARIVRLDGRPRLPASLTPWLGDSRGRWERDTLVVETTNFNERTPFRGSDEKLRLVERFSMTDANTLRYEFTVDNPTAFTKPWTVVVTMTRSTEPMFEYACHEGNYGLLDTLRGARYDERNEPRR